MEEKPTSKIFSENIKRFRKQQGLSQYDIADMSGISRRMISHYENDGILPPVDKLEALAKILGVKVHQFFEDNSSIKNSENDLSEIDPRSVKKLREILSLPPEDRNDLYRILNKMIRKNQLEQEHHSS